MLYRAMIWLYLSLQYLDRFFLDILVDFKVFECANLRVVALQLVLAENLRSLSLCCSELVMASLGPETAASPVPSSVDAETLALTPSLHLPRTPGIVLEDSQCAFEGGAQTSPVEIVEESQGGVEESQAGTISAQVSSTPGLTEIGTGVLCQKLDAIIDIQRAILNELKAARADRKRSRSPRTT